MRRYIVKNLSPNLYKQIHTHKYTYIYIYVVKCLSMKYIYTQVYIYVYIIWFLTSYGPRWQKQFWTNNKRESYSVSM